MGQFRQCLSQFHTLRSGFALFPSLFQILPIPPRLQPISSLAAWRHARSTLPPSLPTITLEPFLAEPRLCSMDLSVKEAAADISSDLTLHSAWERGFVSTVLFCRLARKDRGHRGCAEN